MEESAFSHSGLTIRCKFDPDSNQIDGTELQDEKHNLHKCVTDDGITTESIDPKYRTIKQRERSARNDPKTQNSLTPGEIESDLSEQLAKAEPSIKRMPVGITMVFNSEEENADFSIRCKLDPGSNEID
jgi:hypothetical protein